MNVLNPCETSRNMFVFTGDCNSDTKAVSFLTKLRSILSLKAIEHIVSWLPEGKIWRIHKLECFIATVLPLFDETSSWNAFLMTLRSYGFKEVSRGPDSLAFYNENFLRLNSFRTVSPAHEDILDYAPLRQVSQRHLYSQTKLFDDMLRNESMDTKHLESLFLQLKPEISYLLASKATPSFPLEKVSSDENIFDILQRLDAVVGSVDTEPVEQSNQRKRKLSFDETTASVSTSTTSTAPPSSPSKKKPKKKWLPPLGPPEAESAAILRKRGAGAWGHTNAEAFSTVSGLRR